jgi:LPPG:FO 2-phospho-L-lactate transferase
MSKKKYLALTGGVGGAKLALGLSRLLAPGQLSFAVNTGDDFEHLGLHISPDIDTLVYTLSGQSNPEMGWGRRDESWQFMLALEQLGGETWFRLGDRDLAMHIERTRQLAHGQSLGQITDRLAKALGIKHQILPMSDDPVRTRVQTPTGWLDFQEYFVRQQCQPVVKGFEYVGAENASINSSLVEVLHSVDLAGVVICPSNPFASIDPILALPGMRQALTGCKAPVIAVSPVVGGAAIKGPTVKMMQELSLPNTATWVAEHYADVLDGFVLDQQDASLQAGIESLGLGVVCTQTVMKTLDDRVTLAQNCLDFLQQLD